MNVLIVDDEPDYRALLGNYLRGEGWTVFLAQDGRDGLERMREAKMDIIISDVYMPNMDGIKFHKAVRRMPEYAETPFLFVSAYDDQHTLDAIENTRIDGFIKKLRPLNELKGWITYLTTPFDRRPSAPPSQNSASSYQDWRREEMRKPRGKR